MPIRNALLVRYEGGYTEVEDAASIATYGRREDFLQLGGISDLAEVARICEAMFAVSAAPRVQTTIGIEPAGETDMPYLAFRPGDLVEAPAADDTTNTARVQALTVVEDEHGNVTFTPELRDVLLDHEEALQRQLQRMANGTLNGSSLTAGQPTERTIGADIDGNTEDIFFGGSVEPDTAEVDLPWPARLTQLAYRLTAALAGDTEVEFFHDGVSLGSLTIAAGDVHSSPLLVDEAFAKGDIFGVEVVQAGGAGKFNGRATFTKT